MPLVSVIVPAFNAATTLRRTLDSIRAQRHSNLQILVVDDGSEDGTREIALQAAREDARVQVLAQANRGVARARNLGLRAASGDFVAPIDADDLWHPEKISRQVAAMLAAGPRAGFAYCWYRAIDEDDRVLYDGPTWRVDGDILLRHIVVNVVGNGSALLARRELVVACGGYDASLFDRGMQGVEDFLLQLQMAHTHEVVVVPEYLVGYRQSRGSMSSDGTGMARSARAMMERVAELCADTPHVIRWGLGHFLVDCARRELKRREVVASARLLLEGLSLDPPGALETWLAITWDNLRRRVADRRGNAVPSHRSFQDYDATSVGREPCRGLWARRLSQLARLDAQRGAGGRIADRPGPHPSLETHVREPQAQGA